MRVVVKTHVHVFVFMDICVFINECFCLYMRLCLRVSAFVLMIVSILMLGFAYLCFHPAAPALVYVCR